MSRFGFYVSFLLIGWAGIVSMAQETAPLRVQAERLQKAKAAERHALINNDSLKLAEAY